MTAFKTPAPATVRAVAVRPPLWPAIGAILLLLVSVAAIVVDLLSPALAPAVLPAVGYLTGSIGVSVLVVVHRTLMQRAQQNRMFEPRRYLPGLVGIVLTAGLLAGSVNAFLLATELAKG
ncbi:hypothetical protein IGS67_00095 [Flavimobilis sp. GY10621]|uniref:DUF202 domain-containing protein n=1 Tax=Flavimobilis rhizosphaerae TaxID=2775421 RepID=A0ABR9DNL2_9MICO|nr:hypothetical protein [Flavimobilis rhizosphaerae]MBD9697902.1 hypothetical protein [Flavimobilis rhizosphaerae]